jgi:hypothetical protein
VDRSAIQSAPATRSESDAAIGNSDLSSHSLDKTSSSDLGLNEAKGEEKKESNESLQELNSYSGFFASLSARPGVWFSSEVSPRSTVSPLPLMFKL